MVSGHRRVLFDFSRFRNEGGLFVVSQSQVCWNIISFPSCWITGFMPFRPDDLFRSNELITHFHFSVFIISCLYDQFPWTAFSSGIYEALLQILCNLFTCFWVFTETRWPFESIASSTFLAFAQYPLLASFLSIRLS